MEVPEARWNPWDKLTWPRIFPHCAQMFNDLLGFQVGDKLIYYYLSLELNSIFHIHRILFTLLMVFNIHWIFHSLTQGKIVLLFGTLKVCSPFQKITLTMTRALWDSNCQHNAPLLVYIYSCHINDDSISWSKFLTTSSSFYYKLLSF